MRIRFPSIPGELMVQHIKSKASKRPTIIFLHDALGCIKTWRDFPKTLAQKTHCNYLVYDRLGYGTSSKDPNALSREKGYLEEEASRLLEMIEILDITKPILFGHSDGGSIALIAASKGKSKIKGIIVEAAHIFVEAITLRGIERMKENYQHGDLRWKLLKYHGSKVDTVFNAWADTWLDKSFKDWNITPYLSAIVCPCMVLQGENDEYGSIHQVEGIRSGINRDVEVAILERVGHVPHKESKEYVLKITSNFIKHIS